MSNSLPISPPAVTAVVTPDAIAWFDAMPDAVLVVDAQHRVLFANQSISRMFGFDRDWLVGRSMETLLPIRTRTSHAKLVAEFARGGASTRAHEASLLTGCHADGREFQVDVTISRRATEQGATMIAIIRDATHRVAQARALEDKSEKFRLVAEASHDALYTWDPVNGTTWLGDGVSRFLGYNSQDAVDRTWWESRIHPDDRARVMSSIDRHMQSTALTWSMEYRFKRADDTDAIVLNRSIVTRDEHGVVQLAMGALMDVTALREAQAHMVHANKMEAIGRLAGGVAHDFNNLLGIILSSAELLMDGYSADDPRLADVSEIHQAAIRASQVTRQLLTLSRRDPSRPRVLSLSGAINDVRRLLQRLLGGNVEIVVRAAPSDVFVYIDPTKFEQVLINLAVNARDAMPDGGELAIEIHPHGSSPARQDADEEPSIGRWVQITIHDSGRGIPPDVLPHVFEPFFTTKDAEHGTGLGLSICYAIVRDAGGDISVMSEIGVGTTFSIRLPVSDTRATACTPTLPAPAVPVA